MLGLKQNSKLSLAIYVSIHVLAAALVFGCENRKSFYDVNRGNIDEVPMLMENPDDPIADDIQDEEGQGLAKKPLIIDIKKDDVVVDDTNDLPPAPPAEPEEPKEEPKKPETKPTTPTRPTPKPTTPKPTTPTRPAPKPEQPKPAEPKPVEQKPVAPTPAAPKTSDSSKFIKVAFWVVQNEARKIGTPCNFYVSRVLELSGYSDDGFLANDFDIYAKKHFSTYKDERFVTNNLDSERLRLKRYIWSYPARTPFILQWERPRPKPGHIAIVERIGDQLVVYQASLNRHIARREQTSIDRLLSTSRGANLTVYSEFVAR